MAPAFAQCAQDYPDEDCFTYYGYRSGNAYPQSWAGQIYPYVKSTGTYTCPDDRTNPSGGIAPVSYGYNMNIGRAIATLASPASIGGAISKMNAPVLSVLLYEVSGVNADVTNPLETSSVTGDGSRFQILVMEDVGDFGCRVGDRWRLRYRRDVYRQRHRHSHSCRKLPDVRWACQMAAARRSHWGEMGAASSATTPGDGHQCGPNVHCRRNLLELAHWGTTTTPPHGASFPSVAERNQRRRVPRAACSNSNRMPPETFSPPRPDGGVPTAVVDDHPAIRYKHRRADLSWHDSQIATNAIITPPPPASTVTYQMNAYLAGVANTTVGMVLNRHDGACGGQA